MEFVPTGSELKFNVAPPVAVSCALPRLIDPSRKVTVPVGTLLPDWGAGHPGKSHALSWCQLSAGSRQRSRRGQGAALCSTYGYTHRG